MFTALFFLLSTLNRGWQHFLDLFGSFCADIVLHRCITCTNVAVRALSTMRLAYSVKSMPGNLVSTIKLKSEGTCIGYANFIPPSAQQLQLELLSVDFKSESKVCCDQSGVHKFTISGNSCYLISHIFPRMTVAIGAPVPSPGGGTGWFDQYWP